MIWTVLWTRSAKNELARLWTDAADPQAITDSSDRIDEELRVNAHVKGIPFGTARVYSDDPLAVLYELDPGDCKATVVAVKIIQ
jgi:hypothetical protein